MGIFHMHIPSCYSVIINTKYTSRSPPSGTKMMPTTYAEVTNTENISLTDISTGGGQGVMKNPSPSFHKHAFIHVCFFPHSLLRTFTHLVFHLFLSTKCNSTPFSILLQTYNTCQYQHILNSLYPTSQSHCLSIFMLKMPEPKKSTLINHPFLSHSLP
jgi:hypothetical protein